MPIRISKTYALWLLQFGKKLVEDGLGIRWDPNSPDEFYPIHDQDQGAGLIDRIPIDDNHLWTWVHALLNFARTVAGVMAYELTQEGSDQLIEGAEILSSLGDDEDTEL